MTGDSKVPDSIPRPGKPCSTTPRWMSYIPMTLTWIRIALIPLFVFIFYLPIANAGILCFSIFLFASFSDYLDGYLARKWDCTSSFGSFLDPVADKLLVTIALILLTARKGGILLPICTSMIVSREIFISAWREWMTAMGRRESVSVGIWGKWKTSFQMITISLFLLDMQYGSLFGLPSQITCIIASILSIYSAMDYVNKAIRS